MSENIDRNFENEDFVIAPTDYQLGRQLGDCSLRSVGCECLFSVIKWVYPPHGLIDELCRRPDLDPDGRIWLKRLSKCVTIN